MAIPVLLILAVLWAAFFVWPLLSNRSERRGHESISDFTSTLGAIGKTGGFHLRRRPAPPSPIPVPIPRLHGVPGVVPGAVPGSVPGFRGPRPMTPTQRRRRDVLLTLTGIVLGSLLLAAVTGSPLLWLVQLAGDGLLGLYVWLLVRMRTAAQDRRVKVRYLPQREPQPALALRRTASS